MNKFILVLPAVLCSGMLRMGVAQPVQMTYDQALLQSKQNIQAQNYLAAEKNAQKSLALATLPVQKSYSLLLLGESFYKRKLFPQALTQWNQAAALENKKVGIFQIVTSFASARVHAIQGDAGKTIAECSAAFDGLNAIPGLGEERKEAARTLSAFLVADAYLNSPQLDVAKDQFTQILEESKGSPVPSSIALFKLGQIELLRSNYQNSLTLFEQVVKMEGVSESVKKEAQGQIDTLKIVLPFEAKVKDPQSGYEVKIQNFDQNMIEDLVGNFILDAVE